MWTSDRFMECKYVAIDLLCMCGKFPPHEPANDLERLSLELKDMNINKSVKYSMQAFCKRLGLCVWNLAATQSQLGKTSKSNIRTKSNSLSTVGCTR